MTMLMLMKQNGFVHIFIPVLLIICVTAGVVWAYYSHQSKADEKQKSTQISKENKSKESDTPDTLSNPEKVTSADKKTYFVYGAPAGQNNKKTKRIIISLPGHSTTADDGYEAWVPHLSSLKSGTYALAEFNWWNGGGNGINDYYKPTDSMEQIRAFLKSKNYSESDMVVLHGFSRGSANTYAFIANDRKMGDPVFDAVISNSGKYESSFPVFKNNSQPTSLEYTKYFSGIPWILVCGGKDPNVGQSDCKSMEQTETFLQQHNANVLALLEDPHEGHGAFHKSSLGLPKQAIDLIEQSL